MIKKKAIILCVFVFACFALFFIGINSVIPANAEYEEQSTIVDDDVQLSESVNIQMNSDKGKNGGALLVFGKNERSQFDNVSIDSLSNVKLIKNANYFIINPKHAENSTKDNPKGTCTTVAMQLLTGYHNYYSDRRILPVDSTEYQFVSNDYGDLSKSPIFKRELVSNGCSSLGTEEGVFRGIFNNISGGGDGDYGQAIPRVVDATKSFIKKYAKEDVKNSISLDWGLFSSENAKKEIDNDRPVVLGMLLLLPEKSFHVVPAYGYATVNGKNGFLVHYGWGGTGTMVWVPASNFGFCVTMSVNHQHNLIDTGKRVEKSKNDINGDTQKENYTILKCVECKYTTPDFLYETSGTTITKAKYNISGTCKIPDSFEAFNPDKGVFESTDINTIGELAFDGQTGIDNVIIPQKVKTIKAGAFQNCSGLRTLILPTNVKLIEADAFKETSLNIVYYKGTRGNFDGKSFNGNFRGVKVYFYSAYKPTSGTDYWRYVSGYPQVWGSMKILDSYANGVSRRENTTQITLIFSEDPGSLTKDNFRPQGCKVTGVSGRGVGRVIEIEKIKVRNKSSVNIVVTPANEKYFENPTVDVTVYRMCAYVNYCDYGRSFFSGQFDTLFPRDVIYGEDAGLPIPKKKGYEFDGWFRENDDGSFESISYVPLPYFSETPPDDLTVYAKWKRAEVDFGKYPPSHFSVSYNTRGEDFNPRDMFVANTDTYLSDFTYALREVLVPALSRVSYNGYTYEYNTDLIYDMVPLDDFLTATITLKDNIKFSNGDPLIAEDFKAYYEMIKSMYSVLPEPWSLISSVDVISDSAFTIELTDRRDFAYVLHEFRAIPKRWLDDFVKKGEDPFEYIPEVPVYGKYRVEEFESDCRIGLTANENYLWATDTRITNIDIFLFSDATTTIMGFQACEFDISFNFIEMDDEGFFEWGSECYQYDDRSRFFLGIGRESPLCRDYEEWQLQGLIKILGRTIDYQTLNDVFIHTIREKSGWYTDNMIEVEYDGSPWWADMAGNPLGREDVIMLLGNYGIDINDLDLEIYVPDNDICRKIAELIVVDFEAVGISAGLNIAQNKSEMKTSDLCLFLYDFTGGNVFSDSILNMEDVDNQVFLFISEEDMATLESLKYEYKCADTNEEKKEIMLEIHDIMIQYVIKLNVIKKFYLMDEEIYRAIEGDVWRLIY